LAQHQDAEGLDERLRVVDESNGGAAASRAPAHIVTVDPRRSMKAATSELEGAIDRMGANLEPPKRRATALLASELIAQVVGRDLGDHTRPVNLLVTLLPDCVHLETRGPLAPVASGAARDATASPLAEWGQFLLDRLADRWGVDEDDPRILWAEIARI
jgi:hypothetical protein